MKMRLEGFKIKKLVINGEEFYCDDVIDILPPTDLSPWWQINFKDGRQIWASGNVTILLEPKGEKNGN